MIVASKQLKEKTCKLTMSETSPGMMNTYLGSTTRSTC